MSVMILCAWLKAMDFLSVFRSVSRLVVMIEMMLREMASFFVVLFVVLAAFASAEFVAYGYKDENSQTWLYSLLWRFSGAFSGAALSDDFTQRNRVMGTFYGLLFVLSIGLLLLNLVIAIMATAYEKALSDSGEAYWARRQYLMIIRDGGERSDHVMQAIEQYLVLAYFLIDRHVVPLVTGGVGAVSTAYKIRTDLNIADVRVDPLFAKVVEFNHKRMERKDKKKDNKRTGGKDVVPGTLE
eukprot:TRINITY_DN58047_c0_g1_i2.p1 TRINITY_DN58047_c0_g1~~TRINITY_DN58047_c0_g1_i2.p1  ORF type:complete len:241 (+),score=129.67 TRINITY_DN58047_c0_g1_i2:87-809(+)